MYVDFEIAAFFPSPYSRVKKRANFKTNIHLDSVESFIYYLSSNTSLTFFKSLVKGMIDLDYANVLAFSLFC